MLHKCSKCEYMTTLKANLTRHCVRKHCIYENPGIENTQNIDQISQNTSIDCQNIHQKSQEVNLCDKNVEIIHPIKNTSFQCDRCTKVLSCRKTLTTHNNICKGVLNPLECYICNKIFLNPSAKSRHIKSCTPPPPPPPPPPPVPPPPLPYKKKQIPQSVRIAVWDTYIGRAVGETNCTVCNTAKISQFNFHCGHIIAERNGGDISIENLRPICKSCNSSMRTTNLEEYKQQYFK